MRAVGALRTWREAAAASRWSRSSRRLRREVAAGGYRDRVVLAARFDGFGMRIGELLNAQRLAAALDARFRFLWPDRDVDGIRPADEVFEPAFLEAHLLASTPLEEYRDVRGAVTVDDLAVLRDGAVRGLWLESKYADRRQDRFRLRGAGVRLPDSPAPARLFDELPLVPRLATIRDRVRAEGPIEVVVHVRRGDVVRGAYRLGGTFADKALPIPVLDALTTHLRAEGVEPVHVGSAAVLGGGRIGTSDVAGAEDEVLLEDFCRITTARRVVAGSSAFARVAALIGGGRPLAATDVVGPAVVEASVLGFVRARTAGAPDPEVALACAHLLRIRRGTLSAPVRAELLDALIRADPEDPAPVLARAAVLAASGEGRAAADLLEATMPGPRAAALHRLLRVSRGLDLGVGMEVMSGATLLPDDWAVLRGGDVPTPWRPFAVGVREVAVGDAEVGRRLLAGVAGVLDDPAARAAVAVAETSEGPGGSAFRAVGRDLLGR